MYASDELPDRSIRVAAVAHIWPHYRVPVMQALDETRGMEFTFCGRPEPFLGIEPAPTDSVKHFRSAAFAMAGSLLWQWAAIRQALSRRNDAVIYIADQHHLSTWIAAPLARLTGKAVLFWSHGWIKQESELRALVRRAFHKLANRVLVYSDRGRERGIAQGFPAERLVTVYNSLDLAAAERIIGRIEDGTLASVRPRVPFEHPERPLVTCIGRLTEQARLGLLLDAAQRLESEGRPVNVLLVGDGPEREGLERLARQMGLAVRFYGACYDEEVTGQILYHSDLVLMPGKIGLTAIHALMYGTPAITHGDLDHQMPEVEAIEPGRTGALFERGDAEDLARVLGEWLGADRRRDEVRADARKAIRAKWNPQVQARIIAQAIRDCVGQKG